MAQPWLLYENIYEDGTIAAQDEASGFPDDNIIDWRLGTPYRWKSAATVTSRWIKVDLGVGVTAQPDTVVVAGHNLSTAGYTSLLVESSTDDFSSDTDEDTISITADLPIVGTFSPAAARRYWRIRMTTAGAVSEAPQIGVVTLGRRLTLDRLPISCDPYFEAPETEWTNSLSGSLIGANFRYVEKRFSLTWDDAGLAATDLDDGNVTITGAVEQLRDSPVWFAWDTDVDADGVYLCRAEGGIGQPFVGSKTRRNPRLNLISSTEYV